MAAGQSRVIRTEYAYALASDHSGNVKEIREYSFSGALRRKTQLSYLHESNNNYIGLNLLDRVAGTLVYDGANQLVAGTEVAYDLFSLYAAPNAIRHDPAYGHGPYAPRPAVDRNEVA